MSAPPSVLSVSQGETEKPSTDNPKPYIEAITSEDAAQMHKAARATLYGSLAEAYAEH